ncbi:zinc finger protein RFP-like isoform X2 [Tiliqua scincoides]|uniref:zinc finger protein RFP-like isoform X2 n=1 Tax=Tiliqua scincoides TaxID=71010 RepID=UPI0034635B0A
MAAPGSLVKEYCEEVTCPVCLEYFTDPVITECGHNFCSACLTQSCGEPGRSPSCCPECREPIQQCNVRPNRKLTSIVEITRKFSLQVAKGTEGTGGACERHQEPLKLFCRDDEVPICVVCDRSKEHREHQVVPVEEAAEEYKKQLEEEKQEILSVFKEMHKFLEDKERFWLMELVELEKEIKKIHEENLTRLSEEIFHFSDLIKAVEGKCQQLPSEFLQDIRRTLIRCLAGQRRQSLELSSRPEWRFRSDSLKTSVLKKAMEEFEGSLKGGLNQKLLKQELSKVSVTLDPDTAHPHLVLSEDLKSVSYRKSKQDLPYKPERFVYLPCVLGRERFTSGRHCWEVKVEEFFKSDTWTVGVARDSVSGNSRMRPSCNAGFWAVGKDPEQLNIIVAYTSPEITLLTLSHGIKKIRVFLDYEEGCVEFFNADTDKLIFTFPPASFSGEGIRPFFEVQSLVSLKW